MKFVLHSDLTPGNPNTHKWRNATSNHHSLGDRYNFKKETSIFTIQAMANCTALQNDASFAWPSYTPDTGVSLLWSYSGVTSMGCLAVGCVWVCSGFILAGKWYCYHQRVWPSIQTPICWGLLLSLAYKRAHLRKSSWHNGFLSFFSRTQHSHILFHTGQLKDVRM